MPVLPKPVCESIFLQSVNTYTYMPPGHVVTPDCYQPRAALQSIESMIPADILALQSFHELSFAQDMLDIYQPYAAIQSAGPVVPLEALAVQYITLDDEDLNECHEFLVFPEEPLCGDPEMAKGLADPLTSEADEVGHTNAAESVLNSTHTKMDTSFVTRAGHSQPLVGAASLATNSIQPTSHAFGSYARHNHECVECGHLYDRVQRARDCANRDRGLTPYVCGARCGRLRWYGCSSYTPEGPTLIRGQHQSLQL